MTDDFLERVMSDPVIGYYWAGDGDDTKRRDRQLIVDFLCEGAGGPVFYNGRDMKTTHAGLGISESEYDILMTHCEATLDKFEVPDREKGEVCGFLNSLRPDIEEKQ